MKQELYELRCFWHRESKSKAWAKYFLAARDEVQILPLSRQSCFRTSTDLLGACYATAATLETVPAAREAFKFVRYRDEDAWAIKKKNPFRARFLSAISTMQNPSKCWVAWRQCVCGPRCTSAP